MTKLNRSVLNAGLVLLVTALLAAACTPGAPAAAPTRAATLPTQPVPVTGSGPVVVNNQAYDGKSVVIADVISQGPGWIAVHNQVDGHLGPAIGHAPVKDGDNKDVVVQIDPGQATPIMYAMLHVDAGQVGVYEFPGPDVPFMQNGQMVSPEFKATIGAAGTAPSGSSSSSSTTPSVTVQDQNVTDGRVVIAEVVSSGAGWIAIHVAGANGEPDANIGYAPVKDGVNQNVIVTVDQSKVTPVMFAMLHTDAGEIGTYEFPGDDAPVMVNGQMVAPAFHTSLAAATAASTPAAATQGQSGTATTYPQGTLAPAPETPMVMATAGSGIQPLVQVSDQQINNGVVTIETVDSNGPGWIVVYSMSGGQPDQPIGHTAVNDGENKNVQVQVDAAKVTDTLYAQLHVDGGQIGTFEYPGPDAPLMIGVQMISGAFRIGTGEAANVTPTPEAANVNPTPETANAVVPSIKVEDQEIHNGMVVIAEVVSNGDAWLVIHPQNASGGMGDLVGFAKVTNGVNTNVMVPVDTRRVTETMYAMLHEDVTKGPAPVFPGADVPVTVNGEQVAPAFHIMGELAGHTHLNVSQTTGRVPHLVDAKGMSLYLSLNDTPGKSNCTGDCLNVWHPLLANGRIAPGEGVDVTRIGVIVLPDGTRQITYNGAPLYYYVNDVNPDDINGQGVDGSWFLALP